MYIYVQNICVCECVRVCVYIRIHIHTHIHTHRYSHTSPTKPVLFFRYDWRRRPAATAATASSRLGHEPFKQPFMTTNIHMYINAYVYMCMRTYICMHTSMHTHIHIHRRFIDKEDTSTHAHGTDPRVACGA